MHRAISSHYRRPTGRWTGYGASGPRTRCLRALVQRTGDGLGGGVHAELGFEARESLPHGVKAEEQLPGDVRLVLDRGGCAQHLGLARGQAEAVERVGAEARDLLLEQEGVRIAGQEVDAEAPAVAHADER